MLRLVPNALEQEKEAKGFHGKWKMKIIELEQDFSSHPCFLKKLCKEQLQASSKTLNEAIRLVGLCVNEGKLQMQSE